ncbi:MAG: hypothetical protein ACI9QL_005120, partial [Candidatus Omnitrophota bacterium]
MGQDYFGRRSREYVLDAFVYDRNPFPNAFL